MSYYVLSGFFGFPQILRVSKRFLQGYYKVNIRFLCKMSDAKAMSIVRGDNQRQDGNQRQGDNQRHGDDVPPRDGGLMRLSKPPALTVRRFAELREQRPLA